MTKFLAAKMKCSNGHMNALVAKTINYRAALQWLKLKNVSKTILETYNLLLASLINNCYNLVFLYIETTIDLEKYRFSLSHLFSVALVP